MPRTRVVRNESITRVSVFLFYMYIYVYIYTCTFSLFSLLFFSSVACERAAYVYIITRIRVPLRDKFVQKVWAVARMDI